MYTEKRLHPDNSIDGWTDNFASSPAYAWTHALKFRISPEYRKIMQWIKAPVLDAGCGAGEWLQFLYKRGFDVYGVDYSKQLIERNQRRYPKIKWKSGDIRRLPYEDQTFGGIFSWGVIEHDPDGPQSALREFFRVLKLGACCLVTVPVDSPRQRQSSQLQFTSDGHFFQFFFTTEELAKEVEKAGFEVCDVGILNRTSPALVAPRLYKLLAGSRWFKLFRIATLMVIGEKYCNMAFCVGRRPLAPTSPAFE